MAWIKLTRVSATTSSGEWGDSPWGDEAWGGIPGTTWTVVDRTSAESWTKITKETE